MYRRMWRSPPADFQAVTDNLEAPADHIFSKWDGFPENGQFTADEQLTASFADSREIIEVTPKDPDQPFNPENADDGNNSQKTPQGFVRVIFESGEHGTFGTYAGGQDKVKVAYDVKAGQTWAKVAVPAVTAKPGYTAKSGAELWNPQLPGEAETVTGGTYTAQYTKNTGGKSCGIRKSICKTRTAPLAAGIMAMAALPNQILRCGST